MHLAPRETRQPRTDEATSDAAHGTAAFGQLYTEHFDGLFDFVARMVRDADLAGEIVQATFTKAWDELRAGHELQHPKAWLYTVARNNALDELRRQQRLTDEPLIYAQPDPSRLADPQAVAEDNELVDLVWSSAAALTPDEYSLLDLHVRHGFGAADLADALELERGAVYTRLSRLRNSLEESVASTLLIRRGSEDCQELAAIVAEHDGGASVTPQLRRAVRAHIKDCEICTEARRRMVSPVALFGAFVPIVPLAGMREGILGAILPSGSHAAAGAGVGGVGAVAAARHGGKAKYAVAGAGGIAAAAAIVSVALSSGGAVVHDPSSARAVDHSVGVASTDNTVAMRWAPGENAKGYSVMFSRNRSAEPPARENVSGTRYTSPPLGPGRWWFILRSHGRDGGWTDTLRVGPFVISAPVAKLAPHTAAKAKAKAKAAAHHPKRVAHKAHARTAAKPRPSHAQVVANAHATPHARAPAPKHAQPAPTPKKKRKPKKAPPPNKAPPTKAPPKGTTPPAAGTPNPLSSAPVVVTAPPSGQPLAQTPTPTPPGGEGKDDDHHGDGEDDHEHEGGGHDDGGHHEHDD